jgi:membrane-associated phospholipid phosphatase
VSRRIDPAVVLVAGILLAIAALAFVSWLGSAITQGQTVAFDEWGRSAVQQIASPALTVVMRAASRYGAPRYLTPLALLLGFVFVFRGWHRGGLLVVVTLLGATVLDLSLKLFFRRARPVPFFDYPLPSSSSFPSGHALFAVCVVGGLAVIASVRLERPIARIAIWPVAIAIVGLIGVSRIYLGVHYPTDVLAGYLVGAVWVAAVAAGDRFVGRRAKSRREPRGLFRRVDR